MPAETPVRPRRVLLLAAILVAAVFFAYKPAWNAGFIWDDDIYVTHNRLLTAPDGLKRIWMTTDSPSQYFPLVYTALRVERSAWGLNSTGYHLVNIGLHAANALLLWMLLRRLRVPGAWLAAALFALHPVQVESVAWVTELKNVLSFFFCLLAGLAWSEFLEDGANLWLFYFAALAFEALALFAKTTACTWPVGLLVIVAIKGQPVNSRRIRQIVPFFVLGLAMGLVSVWWERHHQFATGDIFKVGIAGRFLIASHAIWFYLGKLIWPSHLAFSYERWHIDPRQLAQYLWLLAALGAASALWFAHRAVKLAAVYYVLMLGPLLGFIMNYSFRYSFVADHYQYMACAGPLILLAAAIDRAGSLFGETKRNALCVILLTTLGVLTWRQCLQYKDSEALWRATLRSTPSSTIARNDLAAALLDQHRDAEAAELSRQTLKMDAGNAVAENNLGLALLEEGHADEAAPHLQHAVALSPNLPSPYYNLGRICLQQHRYDAAITNFQTAIRLQPDYPEAFCNLGFALLQTGQIAPAIANYETSVALDPNYSLAHNDLGSIRLRQGQTNEALAHFKIAAEQGPDFVEAHYNLAGVLMAQNQLDESLSQYEKVIQLRPRLPEAHFMLGRLAMAYARIGQSGRAVEITKRAVDLAQAGGPAEADLAKNLKAQLSALSAPAH